MNIRPGILKTLLIGACLLATHAQAGLTSIADTPLIIASPSAVQPNLMFVLDDSGSMNFDFLPDHVNGDGSPDRKLCRSAGATSSTATGSFNAACCTNNDESSACWTGSAPFTYRGHPPFLAAGFNGLAYNPAIRYLPPVNYQGISAGNQGTFNGTTTVFTAVKNDYYAVQNSGTIDMTTQFPDLEWCTDSNHTDCLRNGNYVLPGTVNGKNYTTAHATTAQGSGYIADGAPEAAGAVARDFGPHYYRIVPNEYCDSINLRNCQVGASGSFTFPAPVRYCKTSTDATAATSAANGKCQAQRTADYTYARYPTTYPSVTTGGTPYVPGTPGQTETGAKATATIKLSSCKGNGDNATIKSFKVNGSELMSADTTSSNDSTTLASSLAGKITKNNYTATASGSTVTITAPTAAGNITYTPVVTTANSSCTITVTVSAFSGYQAYVAPTAAVPATAGVSAARFERVDILPSNNSYPKAAGRNDCAGATCTYIEEMTNFSNWWAYYHSRMQMMKTSVTQAFNGVSSSYRVGYMTINNSQGSAFLNPTTFGTNSTARQNWWAKLTAAKPNNSTPLRTALTTIGRLYGGKYNSSSINGVSVVDPVQYSCQKNFVLLSTDGFWNESSNPKQLNGTDEIGDQDSALDRPMKDGNNVSNTLADTAAYYYNTDLRTGTTGTSACKSGDSSMSNSDVCGNDTENSMQRMFTYTLGLGASGYMQFRPDYASANSGDYYAVAQGLTADSSSICLWQTSGTCTWPSPASNTLTTIDDLWHAAVNGGGTYVSASDPSTLYTGLINSLSAINQKTGASAAVTTSAPNITAGENQAFVSTFESGIWTGELQSRRINTTSTDTGQISPNADWSAKTLLDGNTSRNIYMYSATGSRNRRNFAWSELSASEQAYFAKDKLVNGGVTQFCNTGTYCLDAASQDAAAGKPVVDWVAGDRSNEGDLGAAAKYFRKRTNLLGDIVDSEATYVKLPYLHLTDTGYSQYKSTDPVKSRQGMVYVGANDGMLHAFSSETGQELWAYVPQAVLPTLYKLVDKSYASKHAFFVDGTPVVRDFFDGTKWRTILVSGLGAGGRSYFAIDVTDPTDPQPLWEFTNDNLGYTFGKAEVAKLSSGEWVVMLPSGYNNVSPGDGVGRLFVLNALSGAPATGFTLAGISTGAGSTGTPSGLGHIRAWADNADLDNTAKRVYGGDGYGYVWRFDVNGNIGAPGIEAQRLATLKTSTGVTQPITTRPELGEADGYAMVYVGTGRYMGLNDIGDSTQQSIYAIKDRLGATDWGDPRLTANQFVQQTLTTSTCPSGASFCTAGTPTRSNGTPQAINLSINGGWYVDLPATYERANTDPQLVQGMLIVNTNVIDNTNACSAGGSSWQNYFDYRSGGAVANAKNVVSTYLGNSVATRVNVVNINGQLYADTQLSGGTPDVRKTPPPPGSDAARRTSWRELPTN